MTGVDGQRIRRDFYGSEQRERRTWQGHIPPMKSRAACRASKGQSPNLNRCLKPNRKQRLRLRLRLRLRNGEQTPIFLLHLVRGGDGIGDGGANQVTEAPADAMDGRSEEHTSELQSRGLISYAVFCL